jgi:DNA repair protein RecO (recombination protein O)
MTKPRNYQTEAIVITKIKLGEADRILTLYTPHLGKIQAVAKGVRRPRSKLSGHLELLTHSLVSLARGRNLDMVTGSHTIHSFLPLKTDLELTAYALYVIELINQFTADHIENYALFQLLLDTLQRLEQEGDNELLLRYFELNFLKIIGYRPQLQQCPLCLTALKPVAGWFSPSAGGVLCEDCSDSQPLWHHLSVGGLKVLRLLQDGEYRTVNRLKVNRELAAELEGITRYYIRYLLEREIKSAAWLDTLKSKSLRT